MVTVGRWHKNIDMEDKASRWNRVARRVRGLIGGVGTGCSRATHDTNLSMMQLPSFGSFMGQ